MCTEVVFIISPKEKTTQIFNNRGFITVNDVWQLKERTFQNHNGMVMEST